MHVWTPTIPDHMARRIQRSARSENSQGGACWIRMANGTLGSGRRRVPPGSRHCVAHTTGLRDIVHHRHSNVDERFDAAHAEVDALLGRLGRDVSTLDGGDDKANVQGLADAGERYETATVQFGKAKSVPELTVVRSVILEGLQSTRAVRTRLGFDPGPDPAPSITETPDGQPAHEHSWADMAHRGLGSAIGAGAAGGVLGMLGGALLGGELGGGGGWGDGGDGWGDGGGGWGDGGDGGDGF